MLKNQNKKKKLSNWNKLKDKKKSIVRFCNTFFHGIQWKLEAFYVSFNLMLKNQDFLRQY